MAKRMFGFSRGNTQNNMWWERFDWRSFNESELVIRPIISFGDTWYEKTQLHLIMGNMYKHTDSCKFCSELFSNEKYGKLQDEILRLKVPPQMTKDKWNHVIQNMVSVRILGLMPGRSKPVLLTMYNDIANQFLNFIEIKKELSTPTIADLNNGAPVKLQFKNIDKFPYRTLIDVIVGTPKPLPPDTIDKLNSLPEFNLSYREVVDDEEVKGIIEDWYTNTSAFIRHVNSGAANSIPNTGIPSFNNEVNFNDALKQTLNPSEPQDDTLDDEIEF